VSKLDDLGIDAFCDAVIDGKSYRKIAEENGCTSAYVVKWLSADSERSARARTARMISAQTADEEALEVLRDKEIDPSRAREIAQHLRWRAKVVNPREYGEKLQIDGKMEVNTLTDAQIEARALAIRSRLAAAETPAIEGPTE
jgi:predicted transcriptional regulator